MGRESPPAWSQLPESTRQDFQSARCAGGRCDQRWYEALLPEHRLGALNAYAGLKSAGLWGHVGEVRLPMPATPAHDAGKFDFLAKNPDQLREELNRRPDFADPGAARFGWDARDDALAASLHLKQFGADPGYVNVHFDKSGLSWNPITWVPHLFLDAIGSGYKDVHEVRELLRDRGLDWTRPVIAPPVPGDLPQSGIDAQPSPGPVREQPTAFTWRARPVAGQLPHGVPLPALLITASPPIATAPPPWQWSTATGRTVTLPAPPRSYDFTAHELPGPIRTGAGGRLEFPGVQVVARPRADPLRDLGDHRGGRPSSPARFDWMVGPASTPRRRAGSDTLFGLRATATPRSNLLHELGEQLADAPSRYTFAVRQEPGALRARPGGGIEFPPIHVVATPTSRSYLADLAARLR